MDDHFALSIGSGVGTGPRRIGLFYVSQPSIAQSRTISIAKVIDCGSNSGVFILLHVICDAKISANLK
jgi:hypothetical protein